MTTEDPRGRPPAVKLIAAPTGRPTLYNEDVAAKICAYLASGYSLPQVTTTKQKPMVPPGPPTSVSLSVFSSTQLQGTFEFLFICIYIDDDC